MQVDELRRYLAWTTLIASGCGARSAIYEEAAMRGPSDAASDGRATTDGRHDVGADALSTDAWRGAEMDARPTTDARFEVGADASTMRDAAREVGADAPPSNCSPAGQPTMLAANVDGTDYGIIVDATDVYFTESQGMTSSLARVSKHGGAIVTLAPSGGEYYADDLRSVYWGGASGIVSLAKATGIVTPLGPSEGFVSGIAVDSTTVYWASNPVTDATALYSEPTTGGTRVQVIPGEATTVQVDEGSVYWIDGMSHLYSMAKTGGAPLELSGASGALDFALGSDAVFYLDPAGNGLVRVAKGGGSLTTLVANASAFSIAVDASSVYWADPFKSQIFKVSLAGGSPETVATGQGVVQALALDDSCVYWLNNGNEIAQLMAAAK
jgi:hypothetical protein